MSVDPRNRVVDPRYDRLPGESQEAWRKRMKLDSWVRHRLHEIDLKIIRERSARNIQNIRETHAQMRRDDERSSVDIGNKLYEWRRQDGRLTFKDRYEKLKRLSAGLILPGTESAVAMWQRHVAELATALSIEVSYDVIAQVNGYAWTSAKRIEISPVTNADAYATALHEIGHCAHPCTDAHTRVPSKSGWGTVCVACELQAWRFATQVARPKWTDEMHLSLTFALPTYRPYATAPEAVEIDRFASRLGFRLARHDRLIREMNADTRSSSR